MLMDQSWNFPSTLTHSCVGDKFLFTGFGFCKGVWYGQFGYTVIPDQFFSTRILYDLRNLIIGI